MAEAPSVSRGVQQLRPSVMSTLAPRIRQLGPDHLPLHLGDVHCLPPAPARLAALAAVEGEHFYRYRASAGEGEFLRALVDKLRRDNQLTVTPDSIQVACGATGALQCAAQTLLDPGDDVLLLNPCWPLFRGMALALGAGARDVDFFAALRAGEAIPGWLLRQLKLEIQGPLQPDEHGQSARLRSLGGVEAKLLLRYQDTEDQDLVARLASVTFRGRLEGNPFRLGVERNQQDSETLVRTGLSTGNALHVRRLVTRQLLGAEVETFGRDPVFEGALRKALDLAGCPLAVGVS